MSKHTQDTEKVEQAKRALGADPDCPKCGVVMRALHEPPDYYAWACDGCDATAAYNADGFEVRLHDSEFIKCPLACAANEMQRLREMPVLVMIEISTTRAVVITTASGTSVLSIHSAEPYGVRMTYAGQCGHVWAREHCNEEISNIMLEWESLPTSCRHKANDEWVPVDITDHEGMR